jgi:hypothetical protein
MKQNKETSYNCFKWVGRGLRGREDGSDLSNVQCKPNWNCHYDSPCIMNKKKKKGTQRLCSHLTMDGYLSEIFFLVPGYIIHCFYMLSLTPEDCNYHL